MKSHLETKTKLEGTQKQISTKDVLRKQKVKKRKVYKLQRNREKEIKEFLDNTGQMRQE